MIILKQFKLIADKNFSDGAILEKGTVIYNVSDVVDGDFRAEVFDGDNVKRIFWTNENEVEELKTLK